MREFFKNAVAHLKETYWLPAVSLFVVPLVFFPFFYSSFTAAKELSFKLLLTIALVGLLVAWNTKKTFTFKQVGESVLFWLLASQFIWHGLTGLLSENPLVALHGTYTRGGGFLFEISLFLLLLWTALFVGKEKLRPVFKAFWLSCVLIAAYALLQKMGLEWFFEEYSIKMFQGRVFSFLGNPSLLGQLLLLGTVLGVHLSLSARPWKTRTLFGLGTALILLGLFLSGTRTAVLGLLAVGFLTLVSYRKDVWTQLKAWKWRLLFLLPFVALIAWTAPVDRYSLSSLSLRSLASRFELWKGTLELVQEKPFLGHGQNTFYIHFPEVVSKDFLTLEENLTISADRVHNELLEETFASGIPGALFYLVLAFWVLRKCFQKKNAEEYTLAALLCANLVQNQLSFPDPSIQVVTAFAWGALVSLESKSETQPVPLANRKKTRWLASIVALLLLTAFSFITLVKPWLSQRSYTLYKENGSDYAYAIGSLKEAITWTPYYSELWYELMIVDPSSMARSLHNIEALDGESGELLAWKGNYHAALGEPQTAADYYLKALEKNPHHPNWIRAFADMLYDEGDCETALYLYYQYIETVPDYWKWSLDLETRSKVEVDSYETFFKHIPYFWGTLEKMELCEQKLEEQSL